MPKHKDQELEVVTEKLLALQSQESVAAFSVKRNKRTKRLEIWLSWVGPEEGKEDEALKTFRREHFVRKSDPIKQGYYFFGDDLRPGSGLIRVFEGRPEGPGGTLTCLLSSGDGQDVYFAAAGHVLTDFWRSTSGSIYRYRLGFPPTNSTRFLGSEISLPDPVPTPIAEGDTTSGAYSDIGIVKLAAQAELKQRTTCYGSFGEWFPLDSDLSDDCKEVMKCGSQEIHWTKGKIKDRGAVVSVYGPDGTLYRFLNQIIVEDIPEEESYQGLRGARNRAEDDYPRNPPGTSFASPGDSGTLVVDKETKRPVGMLIAGSILNRQYVVTPFHALRTFWEGKNLIMLRA